MISSDKTESSDGTGTTTDDSAADKSAAATDSRPLTEQKLEIAGITFIVTGVPAAKIDGDKSFMDLPTAGRVKVTIANELARLGAVHGQAFRFMRRAVDLKSADFAKLLGRPAEELLAWEDGAKPVDLAAWGVLVALVAERAGETGELLDRMRAALSPRKVKQVEVQAF
jgi:DNA-binding transcriptional regulator YiaG